MLYGGIDKIDVRDRAAGELREELFQIEVQALASYRDQAAKAGVPRSIERFAMCLAVNNASLHGFDRSAVPSDTQCHALGITNSPLFRGCLAPFPMLLIVSISWLPGAISNADEIDDAELSRNTQPCTCHQEPEPQAQSQIIDTYRTSFSFSTTSLAEISVSAVHAADSVKSSDATMGEAVDDPVVVSRSIVDNAPIHQAFDVKVPVPVSIGDRAAFTVVQVLCPIDATEAEIAMVLVL
ncbi:FAD dependent oxidoreductase [Pseudozyma hubeiensis SY62]|uniref:FAD dependent oxidoreductase n=1 Tax=Pseudozyma hubeiensis (strain SY62) TaxID=1305764 RepID=R9PDS1_PSEHS|nr:FAD dependent oxidoreductase [Pseudozyma hubeiensis SY62]GAC99372.1 FAD dependent oxidoreductase [Pseudozyma hubeiensis SY62]